MTSKGCVAAELRRHRRRLSRRTARKPDVGWISDWWHSFSQKQLYRLWKFHFWVNFPFNWWAMITSRVHVLIIAQNAFDPLSFWRDRHILVVCSCSSKLLTCPVLCEFIISLIASLSLQFVPFPLPSSFIFLSFLASCLPTQVQWQLCPLSERRGRSQRRKRVLLV